MIRIWNNKLYIFLIIFILLNIFNLLITFEKNKNYFLESSHNKVSYWQGVETLSFGNYHSNILKSIIYLKNYQEHILINNTIFYYSFLMQKQIKNYNICFNKDYFKILKNNKVSNYFKNTIISNLIKLCNNKKFIVQSIIITKNNSFRNNLIKLFLNDVFLSLIKKNGYLIKKLN